jgi:DNA topoisomerase-1
MKLLAPHIAARRAALRYINPATPGLTRRRHGKSFVYISAAGRRIASPRVLARLQSLVIPPAWSGVWICADPNGHLQATGFDARGRKQYLYHAQWTAQRNRNKFAGLLDFSRVLPLIRARVRRDLRLRGVPREKVLACIVRLLDTALIRIGNSEYARDNESHGLTTLLNRHAQVRGAQIRFQFKAKSGKLCDALLNDPVAARIIRACQDLPQQELFAYRDAAGALHDVSSGDVNRYLREITGLDVTAKDFRTWGGSVIALETYLAAGPAINPETSGPISKTEQKRREVAAVRAAAQALNNTVSTCRKFYVHPGLLELYAQNKLHTAPVPASPRRLTSPERLLHHLLKSKSLS